MSEFDVDAVVVGAGVIGLSTAYEFSKRGASVIVIEAADRIGNGVSSRNSEVIHAGIYYPTDSLRASFCVTGRRKLYQFLASHGVEFRKCGKLIVATSLSEVPTLKALYHQGLSNGVENLRLISREEAAELEPQLQCVAALHSSESGVLDSHGFLVALQSEIERLGGSVVCKTPFLSAEPMAGGGFVVRAGGSEKVSLTSRYLVSAPGLEAQSVASLVRNYPAEAIPKRYLGKGVYFSYSGSAPFDHLVYPVPIPGALGTHYRKDLGNRAVFGPDLEYVDSIDFSVDPRRAVFFLESIRKYWPSIPEGSLVADYSGIRPKLHGPDSKQPDFRIDTVNDHGISGLICLFGIESPGLTSSLAIGEYVSDMAINGPKTRARVF